MSSALGLNVKQKRFCEEYIKDLSGKQAAIHAGYSPHGAAAHASRLLIDVNVKKYINELKKKRSNDLGVDAYYVLQRLLDIDRMDVADILKDDMTFKPLSEWPLIWRTYLSSVDIVELGTGGNGAAIGMMKKIKWPDKVKNLELLGKHISVQAFRDKLDLSSEDGSMTPPPAPSYKLIKAK